MIGSGINENPEDLIKSNKKKNIDTCDIKGIYYINTFPINHLLDTLILLY